MLNLKEACHARARTVTWLAGELGVVPLTLFNMSQPDSLFNTHLARVIRAAELLKCSPLELLGLDKELI